jgi:hypothetical protein
VFWNSGFICSECGLNNAVRLVKMPCDVYTELYWFSKWKRGHVHPALRMVYVRNCKRFSIKFDFGNVQWKLSANIILDLIEVETIFANSVKRFVMQSVGHDIKCRFNYDLQTLVVTFFRRAIVGRNRKNHFDSVDCLCNVIYLRNNRVTMNTYKAWKFTTAHFEALIFFRLVLHDY